MEYVLARIQVLKNQKPATAMVYVIGGKDLAGKDIAIPLNRLMSYGYTIVCTFEQAGDAYLILQDNNDLVP